MDNKLKIESNNIIDINDIENGIIKAIQKIKQEYFSIKEFNEMRNDILYRERCYCYELYHQLRLEFNDQSNFDINGEMDKSKHFIIKNKCGSIKPDIIIHKQGNMDNNFVVIEVKSIKGCENSNDVKKDLEKLDKMISVTIKYKLGIFLIYGEDINFKIKKHVEVRNKINKNIKIFFHNKVEHKPKIY